MTEHASPLHVALAIVRNYRTFTAGLASSVKTLGLSADGCLIVLLLRDGTGPSNTEIAAALGLNLATATKIIDRLVSDNLVHRKPDLQDRRRIQIYLTDDGLTVASNALDRVNRFVGGMRDAENERKELPAP